MNIDIFGYLAAILTTAAFLPQLIKTLKTKKQSKFTQNLMKLTF